MSAATADGVALKTVLTVDDLAERWSAPGATLAARRKFVWRRVHEWGIPHDGKRSARFSLRAVIAAEERRMGR